MNTEDDAFMAELLEAFRAEAREHVHAISSGLLELERRPPEDRRSAILETIYREAHSLKGAARAVSLTGIETACQAMESVLASWTRDAAAIRAGQFDVLYRALDAIGEAVVAGRGVPPALTAELAALSAPPTVSPPPVAPSAGTAISTAPAHTPALTGPATAIPATPASAPDTAASTVRIPTAKLDALFYQTEEMLAIKQTAHQRADDMKEILMLVESWARHGARLPSSDTEAPPPMRDLQGRLQQVTRQLVEDERNTGRMVDALMDSAKRVLMLPAASALQGFPRLVRDLCHAQDKQAELTITGGELEIDKRILEEMRDPLTHLMRNCVAHGLERPAERARQGKPACGRIAITLTQADSRTVCIRVSDDGAGIHLGDVLAAAIRQGAVSAEEAQRLTGEAALSLVFLSSVSTAPAVTDVSGRGLGLAIVREKVERLGGRVAVRTEGGRGTTFEILLPLSLATFRGLLVEAAGQHFVIPTSSVARVIRIREEERHTVEGREAIQCGGRTIAFVPLAPVLALKDATPPPHPQMTPVLILSRGEQRLAVGVDRILGEQEVLVKGLGRQLQRVRNVSGATLLGSGELVPILDVEGLLISAGELERTSCATPNTGAPPKTPPRRKAILLAEDSITSRMLLKSILISAGYAVTATVDGAAAWAQLKGGTFDAVVSDIEMPRLDGFALTARIRADAALQHLPVVLVTARESREDVERGVEAGANAYIVKRNFEQSDLLRTLERLL